MTPNELLIELRRTHSREALRRLSNGVLTPAKIYNIERGRTVGDAEAAAIRQLHVGEPASASSATVPALPTPSVPGASPPEPLVEPPREDTRPIAAVAVSSPSAAVTRGVDALSAAVTHVPSITVTPASDLASPTLTSLADGLRRVSNSEVQSFKRCRRHWWLAWHRGLRERHESPVGVRQVGGRIHRALRLWYTPNDTQRLDPRDALEALIITDRAAVNAYEDGEWLAARPDVAEQFEREADLERVIVAGYVEWLAETGADAEYDVVSSEAYLEGELPELPGVRLIGRLDVRLRRRVDDVRLFVDHKVVGDFTRVVALLPLDEQML